MGEEYSNMEKFPPRGEMRCFSSDWKDSKWHMKNSKIVEIPLSPQEPEREQKVKLQVCRKCKQNIWNLIKILCAC